MKMELSKKLIYHQERSINLIKHSVYIPKTEAEIQKDSKRKEAELKIKNEINLKLEKKLIKDQRLLAQ